MEGVERGTEETEGWIPRVCVAATSLGSPTDTMPYCLHACVKIQAVSKARPFVCLVVYFYPRYDRKGRNKTTAEERERERERGFILLCFWVEDARKCTVVFSLAIGIVFYLPCVFFCFCF